jgi:transporter family protein
LIIVFFAWGIVFFQGNVGDIWKIPRYAYVFILLSAIATGLSWLFYYKALQLGEVSRVASVDKLSILLTIVLAFLFLGEKPTIGNVLGGLLVATGVMVTIFLK